MACLCKFLTRVLGPAIVLLAVVLLSSCGSESGSRIGADSAISSAPDSTENTDGTESTDSAAGVDSTAPTEVVAETEPESSSLTEPVVEVGFSTTIEPIFANKCATCHTKGGPGTQEWTLTDAQSIVDAHERIAAAVGTGYMPPWPASELSVAFLGDRSLEPEHVQAILDWSAAGAPLDVAADFPISAANGVIGLKNPDITMVPPNGYAGDAAVSDDYRCQVYDPEIADGAWITGYEFLPDQTEIVHHAIGYVLPEKARNLAQERDGEDGKPGWECYGSSGLGADEIFLGWAPGQDATEFPEGTGLQMDPGSFIVVQVHYHYVDETPEDFSALAIVIEDRTVDLDPIVVSVYFAPVEIPCATWESGPLCDRNAAMQDAIERYGPGGVYDFFTSVCGYSPDDFADMTTGVASSRCDIPIFAGGEIISILGHEHEIGSWFRMTLNADTADEQILLDIPVWDFDWQYQYYPEEAIELSPGDVITIECGWDRTLRDPNLEAAYILWADGTNDEMCFSTITTR